MTVASSKRIYFSTKKDIPHILEINISSSECFWTRQQLADLIGNSKNLFLSVKNDDGKILGFAFYSKSKSGAIIKHLAVHPDHQRRGVGTMLINKIKSLLNNHQSIIYCVRDNNIAGHLFLQENGFLVIEVMENYFEDEHFEGKELQDGYLFAFCSTST